MTTHATTPKESAILQPVHYFILRRLHSLLGVIPLGIFLFEHLFVNAFSTRGQQAFNANVALLRSLPMLPFIELSVIFAPLLLHAILGVAIAFQADHNPIRLSYWRNWLYTFQRYSGWAALGFIAFHSSTLRFGNNPEMLDFFSLLHTMFRENPWLLGIYLVGGLSVIYHFANGLCTFCMTWGITIGKTSQYYMGWIAVLIGLGLAGLMIAGIIGFMFQPIVS